MRIGSFKFGNDYNFKPENVKLQNKFISVPQRDGSVLRVKVPETRYDLLKLDKVEIRYNVRKGQADYEAMKSLYKLRSIFGYRLGGVIRRAYVKLAEITRHKENFVSLRKAIRETMAEKKDKAFEGQSSIDKHVRMYSTSDIIFAVKQNGFGRLDSMKYLKYKTWDQHSHKEHTLAEQNDYSFRKLVTDGIKNLVNPGTSAREFSDQAKKTEKEYAEKNKLAEQTFNKEKPEKMRSMKNEVIQNELQGIKESIQWHKTAMTKPELRRLQDHAGMIEKLEVRAEWLKTASYEQIANDPRIQNVYPEMKQLGESVFVPARPMIDVKTLKTAAVAQGLENTVGGIAHFVTGNSPIALIKRGANYIQCSLMPGRYHYDNIEKRAMNQYVQLEKRVDTSTRVNGQEPSMRDLLNNIRFDRNMKDVAVGDIKLDPRTQQQQNQILERQVNEGAEAILKAQEERRRENAPNRKLPDDGANEI